VVAASATDDVPGARAGDNGGDAERARQREQFSRRRPAPAGTIYDGSYSPSGVLLFPTLSPDEFLAECARLWPRPSDPVAPGPRRSRPNPCAPIAARAEVERHVEAATLAAEKEAHAREQRPKRRRRAV
jgi:hypothetical protein